MKLTICRSQVENIRENVEKIRENEYFRIMGARIPMKTKRDAILRWMEVMFQE